MSTGDIALPPVPRPRVSRRYHRVLEGYLKWAKDSIFLRPQPEPLDPKGSTAAECMHSWESTGKLLTCREPELLASYVQGKRCRDWQIKEWTDGVARGYFWAEEFYTTGRPGTPEEKDTPISGDAKQFESIFRHPPREAIIEMLRDWVIYDTAGRNPATAAEGIQLPNLDHIED